MVSKNRIIALAINNKDLRNGIFEENWKEKYIGAGWLEPFRTLAENGGYLLWPAERCMDELKKGLIKRDDVYLVQEELCPEGLHLLEQGVHPRVLFCLESLLYAPLFYDALPKLKQIFKRQVLFNGGTDYARFPSYGDEDVEKAKSYPEWKDRSPKVCLISSNKHVGAWPILPTESPSFNEALRWELHTLRLRSIVAWGEADSLDLYGRGWENLDAIPLLWRGKIERLLPRIYKGEAKNKLDTLGQYQYAAVIENVIQPGYLTEKPIHADLAGCIPVDGSSKGAIHWAHRQSLEYHSYSAFAKIVFNALEGRTNGSH